MSGVWAEMLSKCEIVFIFALMALLGCWPILLYTAVLIMKWKIAEEELRSRRKREKDRKALEFVISFY